MIHVTVVLGPLKLLQSNFSRAVIVRTVTRRMIGVSKCGERPGGSLQPEPHHQIVQIVARRRELMSSVVS
jgi:hypothetical protein